jgi:hypothetical protein
MKHLMISMLLGAMLAWWLSSAKAGEVAASGGQLAQDCRAVGTSD